VFRDQKEERVLYRKTGLIDIRDFIIIFFVIFSFETFPEDETLKVSNENHEVLKLLFTSFFSFSPLSSCFVTHLSFSFIVCVRAR